MEYIIVYALLAVIVILLVVIMIRLGGNRRDDAELPGHFRALNGIIMETMNSMAEGNVSRLESLRSAVEIKLSEIQRTVDRKLDETLKSGLDSSFKRVSDQLNAVHHSMGEMQALTSGIGDLKSILANVKTRGVWGEAQLHKLITDFMSPGQYVENARIGDGFVEFAIRFPGNGEEVLLPIDSKFPMDRYARVLKQEEAGDAEKLKKARREMVAAVLAEAKKISEKYIMPPVTTSFAIMFLPSESLYIELIRLNMAEQLQTMWNVMLAGPSTLCALLTSFQTGFKAMAIKEHSSAILGMMNSVKHEFDRFSVGIAKMQGSLSAAQSHLETIKSGSERIRRELKDIDTPTPQKEGPQSGPGSGD